MLGDSLVFKEKEVLLNYKEKLELSEMDKNPAMLEKRALLEDTDEEDSDDIEYARSKSATSILLSRFGHLFNLCLNCSDIERRSAKRR